MKSPINCSSAVLNHISFELYVADFFRGPVGPRWAPCWPHESCYRRNAVSYIIILYYSYKFLYYRGVFITFNLPNSPRKSPSGLHLNLTGRPTAVLERLSITYNHINPWSPPLAMPCRQPYVLCLGYVNINYSYEQSIHSIVIHFHVKHNIKWFKMIWNLNHFSWFRWYYYLWQHFN